MICGEYAGKVNRRQRTMTEEINSGKGSIMK